MILGEYDTRTKIDCVEMDGFRQCAPPAKTYKMQRAILHPGWREKGQDDIALLRLDSRVQFNGKETTNTILQFCVFIAVPEYIKPICLPLSGITLKGSENFFVAGWGRTKTGMCLIFHQ